MGAKTVYGQFVFDVASATCKQASIFICQIRQATKKATGSTMLAAHSNSTCSKNQLTQRTKNLHPGHSTQT